MKSKYSHWDQDEIVKINPKKDILKFACCDCGLVHDFNFEVDKKNIIRMTMDRNDRSTAQYRRHNFKYVRIK